MAPLFREVILAADLSCAKCREKVANAISRVDIVESMEVHVSEKKVILTCKPVNEGSSSRKSSSSYNDLSRKVPTTAWFPIYN